MEDFLNPDEIRPGVQVGPFRIEHLLGSGGMGQVYAAMDTRLNRRVAIKVAAREFAGRFAREAKAIASLNHPHVCTLHDVGPNYLVMELVDGEALDDVLKKGTLPVETAIDYTIQIAEALQAAHSHGIVHRDLKPANVMVSPSGLKVLDFGLAVQRPSENEEEKEQDGATVTMRETADGQIVGTVRYMSPEQAEGKPADARSDVFALGVVMYEMLCGQPPFQGDTTVGLLASILKADPVAPRKLRHEIPSELEYVILKCLEKDPADRFASARDVIGVLNSIRSRPAAGSFPVPKWGAAAAGILVLAGVGAYGWNSYQQSQHTQFVADAPAQIESLLNEDRLFAAYQLYRQAVEYAPDSAELAAFSDRLRTSYFTITSTPPGATISISDYLHAEEDPSDAMVAVGETPLEFEAPVLGFYLVRAALDAYETLDANASGANPTLELRFNDPSQDPLGMRWVPGSAAGALSISTPPPTDIPGFWLDTYEVTNQEYQQFVDAGGYQNPEYWTEPFLKDGRQLTFEEAMAEFVDATSRPGPSTWRAGTYPEGTEDFPVGGVSWYEAMAYARFAGKTLPGYFHWMTASGMAFGSAMGMVSNFESDGPLPVNDNRAVGRFGHYDMGGNVKEWISNVIDDQNALLGGSWQELSYVITEADLRDRFAREPTFGFRCALYEDEPDEALLAPIHLLSKVRTGDTPLGDEAFAVVRQLYTYPDTPLEPSEPEIDDSSPYWTEETVEFAAPYDGELILAHIFLPKNADPPYQTIVASLGLDALFVQSLEDMTYVPMFLVRSGRALVIPVYQGSLERGPANPGPEALRNHLLKWPIDFSQTINYLETRPETFDASRIGFWGLSWGAAFGPNLLALDPRPQAAVFVVGSSVQSVFAAEIDPFNFLPRVTVPVLMLNAREDYISPLESAQDMFQRLGTPAADKDQILYSGGHMDPASRTEPMEKTLDWFDQYLGPIQ